jgi:antitoxin component of RelBE/YafQ-DinJ toxin-antitoxin module
MKTKGTSLILRLDAETKAKFDHYCQSQDTSVSKAIRQFIDEKISKAPPPLEPKSTESRWKVVNTRLTDSEYQSMSVQVRAENTTHSKWLLQVIRQQIIQAPQLRADEIQAINQALYRLQGVGRNLNQLVKHLHAETSEVDVLPAVDAIELQDSIRATTNTITSLIKASTTRDANLSKLLIQES